MRKQFTSGFLEAYTVPMSHSLIKQPEILPAPFQQALREIYDGMLVPRSHTADDIHANLANSFDAGLEKDKNPMWIPSQKIDKKTLLLFGKATVQGSIADEDVVYSSVGLIEPRKWRGAGWDTKLWLLNHMQINVAINDNWATPAAIVLPAAENGESASVIVGEEVNNPDHLPELLVIASLLAKRTGVHVIPAEG